MDVRLMSCTVAHTHTQRNENWARIWWSLFLFAYVDVSNAMLTIPFCSKRNSCRPSSLIDSFRKFAHLFVHPFIWQLLFSLLFILTSSLRWAHVRAVFSSADYVRYTHSNFLHLKRLNYIFKAGQIEIECYQRQKRNNNNSRPRERIQAAFHGHRVVVIVAYDVQQTLYTI